MSDEPHTSLTARMTVVESTVERLERTVNSMATSMQRYIEEQARSPRPIPFKEIVVTAAATLAVFAGVLQFLDNRMDTQNKLLTYRLEQVERKHNQLGQAMSMMVIPRN